MRRFFYTSLGDIKIEIGRLPRFAIGIEFGAGDGDEIQLELGLYYQIWISYGARWIFKVFYPNARKISLSVWGQLPIHQSSVAISLWGGDQDHFTTVREWYFLPLERLLDFCLGYYKYESTEEECDNTVFSLPEGDYLAKTKIVHRSWKRPRSPFTRRQKSVEFDFETGIPIEGKGENSWDCGMDARFSCSMPMGKEDRIQDMRDKEVLDIIKLRMRRSSLQRYSLERLKSDGYYMDNHGFIVRDIPKKSIDESKADSTLKANG